MLSSTPLLPTVEGLPTIAEALDAFLDDLALEGRSPRTIATYRSLLKLPPGVVSDLTPEVCRRLIAERMKQSRNTARTYAAALKSFGHYLERYGPNPMASVPMPRRVERPHRFLSADDIKRLWAVCPDDTRVAFLLLLCGLRASEALGLRWRDLNGDTALVRGKGEKHRRVALPSAITGLLDYQGERVCGLSYVQLRSRLERMGREAKVPGLHAHLLRHTWASQSLLAGMDAITLQTLGGWQNTKMITEVYAKSALEDAALSRSRDLGLTDKLLG